ncbi:uncharacterized protein LOC128895373 [Hylaeus anthracinus]|uniref:uncharacterized protein LOC128895373 n=1 Tax=Hylaeus anthracinus TaxID=313031 RepID=UPI0023B8C9A3|nr:uncharacterized protein LOC128895373 [Hylaeus anthracinus]
MPGIASATGLMGARIRPVCRPKTKCVELSGSGKPAPFILRPFSSLFNPYPYGCSVLCNHPADCEAKEILRRAKDSWATEGKAVLLPEEMDMIRTSLAAATGALDASGNPTETRNIDTAPIPEELFRKYTETDSRPMTPAPTLASGPALTNRQIQEKFPMTCVPQERTMLVLDLRASSKNQTENESFTWHALTLELPPTNRKNKILLTKSTPRHQSPNLPTDVPFPSPITCEPSSSRYIEEGESGRTNKEHAVIHRRGKRLRKGKYRRRSTYRQQTEVHDLLEPTETQISHIGDGSRRTSIHTSNDDPENSSPPKRTSALATVSSVIPSSFIPPDILKHLCRELDRDKVEGEFLIRRRIGYEEALRAKGESYTRSKGYQTSSTLAMAGTSRVFSRQAVRFEILDSKSLHGMTVLEYIGRHVFVSPGRKLIFGTVFNKFQEEVSRISRHILPKDVREALQEIIGKPMTEEQEAYLNSMIGEITEPLSFRTWCGLCATAERLLCPFPQKDVDPASWLERVDFEMLERRLECTDIDPKLRLFLKEIYKK